MQKLAIIIPYYKIDFFEETLQSLAAQTDNRFTLYIGNDASPDDPKKIIERIFPAGNYHYYDYKENLGGKNLALQWERILENVTELCTGCSPTFLYRRVAPVRLSASTPSPTRVHPRRCSSPNA